MQTGSDSDKRKLLSALAHGSIFISVLVVSIAIPIAILFISEDTLIKDNAKEAINFHLNVWLWAILIVVPSFLTFGLVGLIWLVLHWGLSIWAIIHSLQTPDEPFRYPFIFRIV
ncbi:DUF4870 domain-containing protein [Waterburya agarophytonicola K14]|uniref:DUF4870 domain-containing protein n=1 Tax=Waterburya agarophytonicola KI4 TaxID=2874699 RepID=A0A964C0H8_9CYAN|nr:DUF4870 domain-containing protein [Waterburya agarophytonicola]MCC0179480.1 DUF4870 domain-containing protein [Waterburya agarophytonicola KI4]